MQSANNNLEVITDNKTAIRIINEVNERETKGRARALRENNKEEWKNIVALMKKQTYLWNYVKSLYPELTDENEIADEVLAHYAVQAINNVKQALERFWKKVADKVLADLLNGVNPNDFIKDSGLEIGKKEQ